MRKRFTCDIELSDRDMAAFMQIVAAHALNFTMQDLQGARVRAERDPAEVRQQRRHERPGARTGNGLGRHYVCAFPKNMIVRVTSKAVGEDMPAFQRTVLDAIKAKYGLTPFRKGEASAWGMSKLGHGASSALTMLCRSGYIAAP